VMLEGKVEDLQSETNRLDSLVTVLGEDVDGVESSTFELEKTVDTIIRDKETKETIDYLNKKEDKTSE